MTLQKIKSIHGMDEYVLLPVAIYRALKDQIEKELAACATNQSSEQAYEQIILKIMSIILRHLKSIKAGITQEQPTQRLSAYQAYVSQLERRTHVTNKMLERVRIAIRGED